MNDMTNSPECLIHHDTKSMQVRRDFFELCVSAKELLIAKDKKKSRTKLNDASPICMAIIIDILEKTLNSMKQDHNINNENNLMQLSYSRISLLLYNAFGERAIIGSLFALVQIDYIKKHSINGKTPSYALNIPILQEELDRQAGKDQVQENDQVQTPNQFLFNEKQLEAIGHTTKKKYTEEELKSLTEEQLEARLTPKMREAFNNWRSIQKGPTKLIPKRFIALQSLEDSDADISIETFKAIKDFCFSLDETKTTPKHPKGYFRTRGVDLWDIADKYSPWHQTKEYRDKSPVLTLVSKTHGQISSSFDEDYDYTAEFYPAKPAIK